MFCQAIHQKGAPLNNCFGFVSIATPNGMIANLFGPIEGRRHDSALLAESQVYQQLQRFAVDTNGNSLCIYGDPAYPLRPQLQAPFRNAILTPQQREFKKAMSETRIAVEWLRYN